MLFANSRRRQMLAALSAPVVLALSGCGGDGNSTPEGSTLQLAILSTTDLHQNVISYNYYALAADASLGLERTATLIGGARQENPNNVLLDDGDAIQGTLLGDFQTTAQPIACAATLAIHKVMNALSFDGGSLGNHEFNYGLPFLAQILNSDLGVTGVAKPTNCGSPTFPTVVSNVNSVSTQNPILKPYALIHKKFSAKGPNGEVFPVQFHISILGFVPPQVMDWDQKNLAGKVFVNGAVESAIKYVPEVRAQGADLVVALSHGGLDASDYSPKMENPSYHLTKVAGIDALVAGHSHLIFPKGKEIGAPALDPSLAALPAATVDSINGFVNGVPTVMAQSWGRRLGIIKMTLIYKAGKWVVLGDKTTVESRGFKFADGATLVAADPTVSALVATEHAAAIAHAQQPLGVSTEFQMSAYFALVGDVSAIQIVNQAQIDYVKNFIAASSDPTLASYKTIPVISCSAPFKAGRNGPTDFTDVAPIATATAPVALQVRNPGDLYLFGNNNIQAVKIKGIDLKNWLETSAKQFAQIDPSKTSEQDLVPSYSTIFNYDVFYAENNALNYQIDVTKVAGSRIASLKYNGVTIADDADFIVATNDYRAGGGGNFPGINGSKTIIKSPDANQSVVASYLAKQPKVTRASNGLGNSWSFVKTATSGPVYLRSTPGKLSIAQGIGLSRVLSQTEVDASGFGKYRIDLNL